MIFRFDPKVFLDIAILLRDNSSLDEMGRYRTAVGRAYYAAFLISRERTGRRFDKDRQHFEVRQHFKSINRNDIADLLNQLFEDRVDADYKLNRFFDRNKCNKCINIAERIVDLIENS